MGFDRRPPSAPQLPVAFPLAYVIMQRIILCENAMAWTTKEVAALKELAGVYRLPGGCWAVLTVKDKEILPEMSGEWPEGVEYAWVLLMPGQPPDLRGHRMAGVDNADDASVRKECAANPSGSQHRAHEHKPNWKNTVEVGGQEWPLAGAGVRLSSAPANPGELWQECMRSLNDLFVSLGLATPTEEELLAEKMTEAEFLSLQRDNKIKAKGRDVGPA